MKVLGFVIFVGLSIIFSPKLTAQISYEEHFRNNSEIYFSFSVDNLNALNSFADIISVDRIEGLNIFAYASEIEYQTFRKLGYDVQILKHPGKLIIPEMSSDVESITDWDVYPTYDAYLNLMYQFAADHPDICQIVEAGVTVQGRKILFARISDNILMNEAEPRFMYTSSMHGDELTGFVLMLRLIDSLLVSYGTDTRITNLIDNVEIWINPLANPDGTYRTGNHTVYGATRYNANNYDLNRNFPDPVNGVHPYQQQETYVFRNLQENFSFSLIANFHGGTEVVNYPWDRWVNTGPGGRIHADQSWYQFISHLYADTCQLYSPAGYMTGYDDGITNGGAWYVISGGRQDYTNYFRWGREVTIEISDTKLPASSLLPGFWEYNKRSFLTYMESLLYGVKGTVTDSIGTPVKAKITVIGHDVDNSQIWSDSTNGYFLRMLSPGSYSFRFEADGHYDTTISNVSLATYFTVFELNVEMIPIAPVPVELISLSSKVYGNNVYLEWSTASEINNLGFEIERRKVDLGGAELFEWQNIGFVDGRGTSLENSVYQFTDPDLAEGLYEYRLKQIDYDGHFKFYSLNSLIEISVPIEFLLLQNYPNPFNPETSISYRIPEPGLISLKIYDISGSLIETLVNEFLDAGDFKTIWNAAELSSGIYFYRLEAGKFVGTGKMLLIK